MSDIDLMVNRFLAWKLPHDFSPDAGVSFTAPEHAHCWPVGTNLLTAAQARAMFEHCLAGQQTASQAARYWHDQWVKSEERRAFLRYVAEQLEMQEQWP